MINNTDYTLINALNYQMFVSHCKEVTNSNGTIGHRIVNAILAVIEFPPIIGQIIALFELTVVKAFGLTQTHSSENQIETNLQESTDTKSTDTQSEEVPTISPLSLAQKIWPGNWTPTQKVVGFVGLSIISAYVANMYFATTPDIAYCLDQARKPLGFFSKPLSETCANVLKSEFLTAKSFYDACTFGPSEDYVLEFQKVGPCTKQASFLYNAFLYRA